MGRLARFIHFFTCDGKNKPKPGDQSKVGYAIVGTAKVGG